MTRDYLSTCPLVYCGTQAPAPPAALWGPWTLKDPAGTLHKVLTSVSQGLLLLLIFPNPSEGIPRIEQNIRHWVLEVITVAFSHRHSHGFFFPFFFSFFQIIIIWNRRKQHEEGEITQQSDAASWEILNVRATLTTVCNIASSATALTV